MAAIAGREHGLSGDVDSQVVPLYLLLVLLPSVIDNSSPTFFICPTASVIVFRCDEH